MSKKNAQENPAPPTPEEEQENQSIGEVDEEYSPKDLPRPAEPDKVALEKELRKYVKRAGGFRKGLPKEQMVRAEEILAMLKRKGVAWDLVLMPDTPVGKPGQNA